MPTLSPLARLSQILNRFATGRNIIICFVAYFLIAIFVLPQAEARLRAPGGNGPLDLQFGYTPEKAFAMIESYGEARSFYILFELTGDVIYPVVYTLTFSLFITYLFQRAFAPDSPLQKLHWAPFVAFVFDLLENIGLVILLGAYPQQLTGVVLIASLFTIIKWLAAMGSIALALMGLGALLIKKIRAR
jgi:hypothetical protein